MKEEERRNGEKVFATVCKMLDGNGWKYEKNEERLLINCSARGDDLPIVIRILVDPERKVVMFNSPLFVVADDKRSPMTVAVAAANYALTIGCFDLDVRGGGLSFRIAVPFRDSILSEGTFGDVLYTLCMTVDKYNDKFFMLTKDVMTLDSFLDFVYNKK